MLKGDIQNEANIANLRACEVLQNRDKVKEFVVMSVREPTADRDGVLRVENIGRRGIVDDDGIS